MPAGLAVIALLVVAGCASAPVPWPTVDATSSPTTPHVAVTSTPVPTPSGTDAADLVVTGYGACGGPVVIFYGGCRALLLLEPSASTDFSDRALSDDDYAFEMGERTSSEIFSDRTT